MVIVLSLLCSGCLLLFILVFDWQRRNEATALLGTGGRLVLVLFVVLLFATTAVMLGRLSRGEAPL